MTAGNVVTCPTCGARNRVPASASGRPRCPKCKLDLPWITSAGDGDFASVAEGSPVPVVVDLWAPWCGPCRMISPALEEVAGRLAGKVKLVKVNVDENPGISRRFGVQSIPTLLLLDHGEVVDTTVGARGADALQAWVESGLTRIA